MLLRAIRLSGGRFQPDGADDGFRRAGAEDMAGRRAIVARKRAGRGLRPGAVPALQEQHAGRGADLGAPPVHGAECIRSEEHTSELQSLMRISYAVLWLKKKNKNIRP